MSAFHDPAGVILLPPTKYTVPCVSVLSMELLLDVLLCGGFYELRSEDL